MSCFSFRNVSFRYDRNLVLHDMDLDLKAGEILGLFGHNGAGKTTSIKLILGLIRPLSGQVTVLGGQAGDPERLRHIGYLPENVMFYPQLTGRETLNHFARLKGAPLQQVPGLLQQVGLADAMDARTRTYSKGMRQRLGLAQALLGQPRLLILDEPTVGLDPVATADLYRLLRELRNRGTGIVLCSHVLPGVEPYIDRAAILRNGALQAFGTLGRLREQAGMPVTLAVKPATTIAALKQVAERAPVACECSAAAGADELCVRVSSAEKMPLLHFLITSGEVADVSIHQPTLEDLYVHFIGSGGLSHRGGAR